MPMVGDPPSGIPDTKFSDSENATTSCYLTSTLAPASVSFFLIVSASAFDTPSLTVFGAPSTRSLASLTPRCVTSRPALMTPILFAPASARMTVTSVCSATGAAPPPPAATAGPAAAATRALTPPFSSSSVFSGAMSITAILERESTSCSFVTSAMSSAPWVRYSRVRLKLNPLRPLLAAAFAELLLARSQHSQRLRRGGREEGEEVLGRGDQKCKETRAQLVLGRHLGKRLDARDVQRLAVDEATLDDEFLLALRDLGRDLGGRGRILERVSDRGRA